MTPARCLLPAMLAVALVSAPAAQEPGGARAAFARGVALLHAFEYDLARDAFAEALKAEPGFAMAYWGEAMTYLHPLWPDSDIEAARAALARLASSAEARQALASTPLERDWLRSIEPLVGPGESAARYRAWADALAGMRDRHAGDEEVAAFRALALLASSDGPRDVATAMRAAAVAEEVLARHPGHPGALHYLLLAYADAVHAPLGLRHASAYGDVAPATPYGLHVPTRIHLALGLWDEAARLNERAVAVAGEPLAAPGSRADDQAALARHWLVYVLAQQGRLGEARAHLARLETDAARAGTPRARSLLALARAAWAVETRRAAGDGPMPAAAGVDRDAATAELFGVGLAALKSGDRMGAHQALQQMAALADGPPSAVQPGAKSQPGVAIVTTADSATAAAVMAQQLEAVLLFAEGRREEALVLARQAAIVEGDLEARVGPPLPVKPAHELVGELLVELRRPREAMGAFEAALARTPRRALSLLGLARAATAARDRPAAGRAWAELARVWARADKDLPELKELPRVPPS